MTQHQIQSFRERTENFRHSTKGLITQNDFIIYDIVDRFPRCQILYNNAENYSSNHTAVVRILCTTVTVNISNERTNTTRQHRKIITENMDGNRKPENTTDGAKRPRLNLDKPRYDQSTYSGRAKHFFITTNPLNLLVLKARLFFAREVVESYKRGEDLPYTDDEIWRYKHLVDSAFHPDTGELMFVLGRMSAQVPMNMLITGCMMHYRSSWGGVIGWQWINQTFNAVVNYTNCNMQGKVTEEGREEETRLLKSYVCATGGAVTTALTLNHFRAKFHPIFARFVPFAAVAAANCINIPIMRNREIADGIPVFTENEEYIGESKTAAKTGIFQVVLSRIGMATPSMIVPPIIMHRLEKTRLFRNYPVLSIPTTIGLVGFMLTFSTPLCCALFPQQSSISRSRIEPELEEKLKAAGSSTKRVYFNKGL